MLDELFSQSISEVDSGAFERLRERTSRSQQIFNFLALDLAQHISERLRERGLSRRWLAERLGKRDSEVSKWLSGVHNLTLDSVAKLSDALEEDLLISPRFPMGFFGPLHKVEKRTVVISFAYTSDAHFSIESAGEVQKIVQIDLTRMHIEQEQNTVSDYSYAMAI